MRYWKRIPALLLALVTVLSCFATALAAAPEAEAYPIAPAADAKKDALVGFKSEEFRRANAYTYAPDETVRAIVLLEGQAEAEVGERGSEKAAAQRVKLVNRHKAVFRAMAGIDYELQYEFTRLLNGFSCTVAYGDLEAIAAIEGVKAVHIANTFDAPVLQKAADSKMAIANQMTGNSLLHDLGVNGAGTVVAVLDTGLNRTHEAFQDLPGYTAAYGRLTDHYIASLDLPVEGKYLSSKVPFSYDYAEQDDAVTDLNGHGTHVSGIAVGLAGEMDGDGFSATFVGAAPAAQLLSMKIFYDEGGSTHTDIYFYALEDAYTLGADVINLSIGSPSGFTYDLALETEVFGNIFRRLEEAGIIVSVAAGNEYSMAQFASYYEGYYNAIGPEYTDYGTVASPSTYEGNVSVASLENLQYAEFGVLLGEELYLYYDACTDGVHGWRNNFAGQTLEYVIVTDEEGFFSLGAAEDYHNVNVAGKVAVVLRGDLSFEEKVENAAKAGAIGCIVVNNEPGALYMTVNDYEIPAVAMDQTALMGLAGNSTMVVSEQPCYVDNPEGGEMSIFSNWGTTPMLTLDPAVTSVGGMVYSAVPGGTDTYEVYSGTSMATPNMSGTYANLLSFLRSYCVHNGMAMTKTDHAELARDLIFSSAPLLRDPQGALYSPRKQGSGLASAAAAIESFSKGAYLKNPLQELGHDPEKSGVYEMALELRNDTAETLRYGNFETHVFTDSIYEDEEGAILNPLYAETLDSDAVTVTYEVNGAAVTELTLAPRSSVTVKVTVTLSQGQKDYFDTYFVNGTYVEGYTVFHRLDTETDAAAHATFLAYYGDWTQAPVLEETDFMDVVEINNYLNTTVADEYGNTYADLGYGWFDSGMINFYTMPKMAYVTDASMSTIYGYAGDNLLEYVPFHEEHIAISTPESDGSYHYAELIYMEPFMLRNARHLIMTVTDKETGEVYCVDDTEYLPKAYFDLNTGTWTSTGYFIWDGTDLAGNYVPSGTVATVTYDAVLPYGEAEQKAAWSFDVTVDYTAPTLDKIDFDPAAKTLTVTATDENYLQSIYLCSMDYSILEVASFSSEVKGESFTATFDLSWICDNYPEIYIVAMDYATNEQEEHLYTVEFGLDAAVTLITPYGSRTYATKTGADFVFPEAREPENYSFMFWTPEDVAYATAEEVWYLEQPWCYPGDSIPVARREMTFYALYEVAEHTPRDKTMYYVDRDSNYTGDWAICGWDMGADYYWDSVNPYALNGQGETVPVKDLPDAELDPYYTAFETADKSVRFHFEQVGQDLYTIQNTANGKYLAAGDDLQMELVDTVTEKAQWLVTMAENSYSTLIFNAARDNYFLAYDYTHGLFSLMDDNGPKVDGYRPSQLNVAVLYRAEDSFAENQYYTTQAEQPCYFEDFSDCKDQWYHEAVDFMVANGLMNGMGKGKFEPHTALSRAMVVTVLYRSVGEPPVSEPSTFVDVPGNQWYADAVAWAQDNGIVNGVSATEFEPDTDVTREQIATILWRYAGCPEAEADLSGYADAAKVSGYAKEAIEWAVAQGIMQGDGKKLHPLDSATRAEFACLVMRFLGGGYTCSE